MPCNVGAPTQAAAALSICFLLGACAGDTVASSVTARSERPPAPTVASAVVSPAIDTIVAGQRARLSLTTTDATGAPLTPHAIAWSTRDSTVAGLAASSVSADTVAAFHATVVDSSAKQIVVGGMTAGTATITVMADGRAATATIVVKPAPPTVTSAAIVPAVDTVIAGQVARFTIVTRDASGAALTAREIGWSTHDSSIAAFATDLAPPVAHVVGSGATTVAVNGVGAGQTVIAVNADGRAAEARIVVLPRVAALALRRDTVRLHIGESTVLVATPIDAMGHALANRPVAWRSSDTTVAVVRSNGVVTARSLRRAMIVATAEGISVEVPVSVRPLVGDPSAATPLELSTYDGSGEVVHPDVVHLDRPWNGYRYWMAITPYPNSNEAVENPSVFGSDDGENWEIPAGAINPIAHSTGGHLSDPALVYDERTDRLLLYYRDALGGLTHLRDDVYLTSSADGVRWTTPSLLYSDAGAFVLSPTILRGPDGRWRDWAVNAGPDGCRSGSSGVVLRASVDGRAWSPPTLAALVQPGRAIWHIDVQWVPARHEYWALYAAYQPPAWCATTELFLATSADGERWTTYPSPVLARGVVPAFETAVYRSTFSVDAAGDSVTLWLSGARDASDPQHPGAMRWSAAVARTSVGSLLRRVGTPLPPSTVRAPVSTRIVRPNDMP